MRFFILFLLLCFTLYADAATEAAVKLHYINSYTQALQSAKKENKIVMLLIVEDGCHWCKKFERTTLSNKKVIKKIDNFVKVVVGKYDDIPAKYESHFFPMVYFIDSATEKILATSYGYRTKELFFEDIQKINR
ncbi:thioredoxin family protein [Sulfurimonas sp.]